MNLKCDKNNMVVETNDTGLLSVTCCREEKGVGVDRRPILPKRVAPETGGSGSIGPFRKSDGLLALTSSISSSQSLRSGLSLPFVLLPADRRVYRGKMDGSTVEGWTVKRQGMDGLMDGVTYYILY
ncbi:unnamed protein product [Calypogeia fissa]